MFAPVGKPLDRFLNVFRDFMRTIILNSCKSFFFKFEVIRFTGSCAETARRSKAEFFRAPCREKYALDSITMQSFEKIVLRAPAVGAKIWCLYVCIFCHAPSPVRCAFQGFIVRTSITSGFMDQFFYVIFSLFQNG